MTTPKFWNVEIMEDRMPDTRTPADRVGAVHRHGDPVTAEQLAAATALLTDLLAAAEKHGATLADFDWTIDLPGGCLDVILAKARKP